MTSLPSFQRGDVLFYRSSGDLGDRVIAWRTGSPWTHCEVAVSDTEVIAATSGGIVRYAPSPANAPRISVAPVAQFATTPDGTQELAAALSWLERQLGRQYAFLDWLAVGLRTSILPRGPFLVRPGSYDCSELVARYLAIIGLYPLPDLLLDCPQIATPGDLATLTLTVAHSSTVLPSVPSPARSSLVGRR